MEHRTFFKVDLVDWMCGTIRKVQEGGDWGNAWPSTYCEIGGRSSSSGNKGCPKAAAKTLYEFGRIRGAGRAYRDFEIGKMWNHSKNGTYAMLALRILSENRMLNKKQLWTQIQEAVRYETGDEPATSNQGGPILAYQLWHLGLIVDDRRRCES